MIVYKATNIINGKSYIGATKQPLWRRESDHYSRQKLTTRKTTLLGMALREFGRASFKWEILIECKTKAELNEMERYYIKLYNTLDPNGYNCQTGGIDHFSWSQSVRDNFIENAKSNRGKSHHSSRESMAKKRNNESDIPKEMPPRKLTADQKKCISDAVKKRKRNPDGTFKKNKQEGKYYVFSD